MLPLNADAHFRASISEDAYCILLDKLVYFCLILSLYNCAVIAAYLAGTKRLRSDSDFTIPREVWFVTLLGSCFLVWVVEALTKAS